MRHPSEFVFGTLRLPGEFFLPEDFTPDPNFFIEEFREYMRQMRPIPVTHHYTRNEHSVLKICTTVLMYSCVIWRKNR